MPETLHNLYRQELEKGHLRPDPLQEETILVLQDAQAKILTSLEHKGFFARIAGKAEKGTGVYMYGGVGRGKTMLMDLFVKNMASHTTVRRVHFHEFMLEVHDFLHHERETAKSTNEARDAALLKYAEQLFRSVKVLCFDEFHVTDVADAMILGRLFTALFEKGLSVIMTSNWPPDDLYKGGLQRDRFLPFIELIKERMSIVHLSGDTDYRIRALEEEGTYFHPLGKTAEAKANNLFSILTEHGVTHAETIEVKKRIIDVEVACEGVARFTFTQLCERPHGAADYLAITQRYHTVFLDGIPRLNYDRRNEAKRLMTLIDTLYDARTKLVVTADAPPDRLYLGHDHAFEFQRTISRLLEMQSAEYLEGKE